MGEKDRVRELPAHAARLLAPGEGVRHVTRPRAVRLGLLLFLGGIVLALAVFSAIVEPGFIRLAVLPALPLVGAHAGRMLHSPAIFVTDRRLVFARRWMPALVVGMADVKGLRVRQSALERLLGYGTLDVLVQPPEDRGEGVFLSYALTPLPDAAALASVLAEGMSAGKDV
ncbi:MAG: PH domain-containing protein [Rhodocyclaceae bacterium]|nr:PH domain-containing protein [Rhodocyclaceae bacterium]